MGGHFGRSSDPDLIKITMGPQI